MGGREEGTAEGGGAACVHSFFLSAYPSSSSLPLTLTHRLITGPRREGQRNIQEHVRTALEPRAGNAAPDANDHTCSAMNHAHLAMRPNRIRAKSRASPAGSEGVSGQQARRLGDHAGHPLHRATAGTEPSLPASGTAAVLRTEPYWPQRRGEFWTRHSRRGTKARGGRGPALCDGADPAFISPTTVCSHPPNYRHLTVEPPEFPRSELHRPPKARGVAGGRRTVPP